jgi:hypothetical protein
MDFPDKQTKLLATRALVCTQISCAKNRFSGCNEVMEIVRKVELLTQQAYSPGVCQDRRSHETPTTTGGQPSTIHQLQILDT